MKSRKPRWYRVKDSSKVARMEAAGFLTKTNEKGSTLVLAEMRQLMQFNTPHNALPKDTA